MSSQPCNAPIALIGGEGSMPLKIVDQIHDEGGRVFLIAFPQLTSQALLDKVDEHLFVQLTQLGKAIRLCKQRGVKELVMAGRIKHHNVFSLSLLRFDWTALKVWFQLPDYRADTLLKGIVNAFEQKGIHVMDSTRYLKKQLAKEGVLTRKKPSSKILEDICFGKEIAKSMGALDIGQTVVVKNRTVVAVEAMEGTDACLERAGSIAGEGCVVVKMAKPHQDMRFDVPVIGINTLQKLHKIKASALAIESGKTLLLDDKLIDTADELGLILISL